MQEHCRESRNKLENWPDSKLKQTKLDSLNRKENQFPSKTWFVAQKPKETKSRSDHCTGLCADCEKPQLNYDTLRKWKRKLCKCGTKPCPLFSCTCDLDDEGEVPLECACEPCCCKECMKCQVSYSFNNIL